MQLASALYNEMGIATPEVDYDAAENKVYAALTELGPDRGTAGHADVAAGFVMDAWLGNLRINPKHLAYAPDGTPIRTDLRYALGGAKTPAGPERRCHHPGRAAQPQRERWLRPASSAPAREASTTSSTTGRRRSSRSPTTGSVELVAEAGPGLLDGGHAHLPP